MGRREENKARKRAALLPAVLRETLQALDAGTPVADALDRGRRRLTDGGFEVDYLELRAADTLAPVNDATRDMRLLVAAKLGATRLIDNMPWSRAS